MPRVAALPRQTLVSTGGSAMEIGIGRRSVSSPFTAICRWRGFAINTIVYAALAWFQAL